VKQAFGYFVGILSLLLNFESRKVEKLREIQSEVSELVVFRCEIKNIVDQEDRVITEFFDHHQQLNCAIAKFCSKS
jgi:predicted P-loop ATPase/GTPase